MQFRKVVFWIHLCMGFAAGIVIFIMCITGSLLAFKRPINDWADQRLREAVRNSNLPRLTIDKVLDSFGQEQSLPSTLTVYADPSLPITAAFGRKRTVFVDPYSGETLGDGPKTTRTIFAILEQWHRTLGQPLQVRGLGRKVTGICNLAFLALIISGLSLWLPKRFTWQYLKPAVLYRRGLSGRARNWNWHTVTGIWSALPLLLIVLTGTVMSYTWANNLLYYLTGSTPQARVPVQMMDSPSRHADKILNAGGEDLEARLAQAQRQLADWRSITLRVPQGGGSRVLFIIDQGNGGTPNKRSQLTLDARTGRVVDWEPFSTYSAGRRLRTWARFAHTGEAGGWIGRIVAILASLAGAVLVWTGLSIALRRLRLRFTYAVRTPSTAER